VGNGRSGTVVLAIEYNFIRGTDRRTVEGVQLKQ
jgi:hypothetical protein